jgi:hypothetical protein
MPHAWPGSSGVLVPESLTIELWNRQQAWAAIKAQLFPFLGAVLQSGGRWILTLKPETRSQAQNRLMWPILTEFSRQLDWPINGHMVKISPDDWKDVLTSAFKRETVRLAMGLDGGVVMLGQRTSRFTKAEFSEWVEFLYATAAARGVKLPAWEGEP